MSRPGSPPDSDRRLDSWKEIAAYLNRDVRTVQRWERSQGLPVHRVSSGSSASVFAQTRELDEWLRRDESVAASPQAPLSRRHSLILAGVILTVAVALVVWLRQPLAPVRPGEVAADRKWVLVTDFASPAGESELGSALRFALEQELSSSRWLNTASTDRVEDTLALMRVSLDTTIDEKVGREICLRDGGIDALIVGQVERVGLQYTVGVRLVEPTSNMTLAASSLEAGTRDEILVAIRELARRLRSALGETLPGGQDSARPLERVTTRSLEALDLYTRGVHAYLDYKDPNRRTKSEAFFRDALERDPEFASAQLLLAWSLVFQWVDKGEAFETATKRALPELQRAVELVNLTSESEKHFILGCYYDWREDYALAASHYEIVLDLDPDHHWAMNNLDRVNSILDRMQSNARYWVRVADARPNHFVSQHEAALYLIDLEGRDAAEPYLTRARELFDQDPSLYLPSLNGRILTIGLGDRWLENDLKGALSEAEKVRTLLESVKSTGTEMPPWQASWLGLHYLMLGKLQEARDLKARFSFDFLWYNAYLALSSGRSEEATGVPPDAPLTWLRVDPTSRTRFQAAFSQELPDDTRKLFEGKLALLDGSPAKGVSLLEEGIRIVESSDGSLFQLGIGSLELADAYANLGQLERAIPLLEKLSRQRSSFCFSGAGALWLQVQARLAQLYRQAGKLDEALRVEEELRLLLAQADPDHPILKQLQATRLS